MQFESGVMKWPVLGVQTKYPFRILDPLGIGWWTFQNFVLVSAGFPAQSSSNLQSPCRACSQCNNLLRKSLASLNLLTF